MDCLKDETLEDQPLVIAEGALDGLALVQAGFPRTVAVPGWSASNFDPENYEPFKISEEGIKRASRIVVAQHDDNAGAAMLRAVANFFEDNDVCFVRWPKGCNDANDTLLEHGEGAVAEAISGARSVDPPGGMITGFTNLPPTPERRVWKLDWPEFDKLMAFRTREVSLMVGTPGAGKSTFAIWVANRLAHRHNLRVGLAMFETEPVEIRDQLFRSNGCFDDFPNKDKEAKLLEHLDRHYRIVHRVEEGDEVHGMMWLKRMIHKLCARDGCSIVVIDPWNEIEHMLEPGENMTNYINLALMRLRQWAEKYDIHIMLIAHPKKMNGTQKPLGYDVSDSAAFANKPGFGWTIHLEEDDKTLSDHVSLTTWKVRSRQMTGCAPGMLRMIFLEREMIYRPMSRKFLKKAVSA